MCFLWVFVGLKNGNDVANFPSMVDVILIETDVIYASEICRCF